MCLVRGCPYKPISFGLCGGHYTDYKKSKEHKTEVATYELLATHFVGPCSQAVYRKRLLTITKGLKVKRQTKTDFLEAMMKKFKEEAE